ncbi:MAG: bifunctional hydroxymethylpyrimidine kinase/phosphomethylpyrimidine kinase [Clostridia bacterium]|nr:bifunctional hydroxymethylpyrimidine kinase/phosphomethylpyrimidine kinase [Clostridia bacterium]
MNKIVGIGACVMDTLITVPNYPKEDTKLRATSSKIAGGGPTATGIVAASKLGEDAGFIGVLSGDNGGRFLKEDFEKYGVGTDNIDIIDGYRSFTSTIWLASDTATRTCVFDKGNLPALKLDEAKINAVKNAELLMIDGNEMDAAEHACKIARENGTAVLYDCGGLYEGVERLLKLTDIMIPSEEFALGHTGCDNVKAAAEKLFNTYSPKIVVITMGKLGGVLYDGRDFFEYPAFLVDAVDSNGSGDVFHGAYAAALCKGFDYKKACIFSSAVSAIKCTGYGARESVPNFETVKSFLKEKNYEL